MTAALLWAVCPISAAVGYVCWSIGFRRGVDTAAEIEELA